jgi:YidC/Oxa1 family membrane protein insertase
MPVPGISFPAQQAFGSPEVAGDNVPLQRVIVETEVIRVELTNAGGQIVSFQLLDHMDGNEPVEMIFTGGNAQPQAFGVAFGNMDDVIARRIRPEQRNFRVRRVSNLIVEFSQDFSTHTGANFTMVKRYEFQPNEYMFELTISLDGGHAVRSFDFQGAAYTLIFSPQIGPSFDRLDQRSEFRRYLTYRGRMRTERVNERDPTIINTQPSWAAIVGKYFTLIAMPLVSHFDLAFSAQPEPGLPAASRLFITRPASSSSRIEDKFYFYLGPKNQANLIIYDRGDNGFRIREAGVVAVADTRGFLAPLERALKWLLNLFYRLIPNYGVAIIFLTILVKILMFPLTKKGSEATLRMQALAPKIKEIQAKYKENPKRMNAEMAEFYKKEGYNPLSGCFPMLIQMPIFFAMFNMFNTHFDLRGAMFIPGWIPDLSVAESVYDFPDGFVLPLLGWTAIRIMPVIYVGSQLLYGKVTQTPDQKGNAQMKLMLYAMPIVFFFVLYEMPSGLLLYWIMSNILTMVQQVGINKYIARKKAIAAAQEPAPAPLVAPPGGTRKKKKK